MKGHIENTGLIYKIINKADENKKGYLYRSECVKPIKTEKEIDFILLLKNYYFNSKKNILFYKKLLDVKFQIFIYAKKENMKIIIYVFPLKML